MVSGQLEGTYLRTRPQHFPASLTRSTMDRNDRNRRCSKSGTFALLLILIVLGAAEAISAQTASPTPQPTAPRRARGHGEPTKADILRGAYGPYRANNDLLFYHLDIRIDPEKKFIS